MNKQENPKYRERVYSIVRRIPAGRVMTYVMHASPDGTPWHRVLNAQGKCSTGRVVLPHDKQQRMLEQEGVVFDKNARCDLQTFLWIPKTSSKKSEASLYKSKSSTRGRKR